MVVGLQKEGAEAVLFRHIGGPDAVGVEDLDRAYLLGGRQVVGELMEHMPHWQAIAPDGLVVGDRLDLFGVVDQLDHPVLPLALLIVVVPAFFLPDLLAVKGEGFIPEQLHKLVALLSAVKDPAVIHGNAQGVVAVKIVRLIKAVVPEELAELIVPQEVDLGEHIHGHFPCPQLHVAGNVDGFAQDMGGRTWRFLLGRIVRQTLHLALPEGSRGNGSAEILVVGHVGPRRHMGFPAKEREQLLRCPAIHPVDGDAVAQVKAPRLETAGGRRREIVGKGGGRHEEHNAHKEAHHGGAVLLPAAAIVLGRQHAGQAEQAVGQTIGALPTLCLLHIVTLPDGLHRRHLHGPAGGDPGGDQHRHQGDAHRQRHRRPGHMERQLAVETQGAELLPQEVEGHANAADAG